MQFYFAFHLVCIIFVPDNFSIRKIQMMKRQGNILISLILVHIFFSTCFSFGHWKCFLLASMLF